MINVTKETFDEFMIEIGKAPLLTPEQESLYIKQAQQGSLRAMQAICNANMRFVGFGRSARYEQPGVYSKYFFSNCRDSSTGSCFWGYSMGTSSSQNFSSNS